MKKTLSTAIAALFLLQNFAFAQVNNASDIINCSKNPEDSFCKSINITKEEIPLKNAILKKQYYEGYLVTFENNGNNPIEITKINNEAPKALKRIKDSRKEERFPRVLAEPVLTAAVLPIWLPVCIAWSMSMNQTFFEAIKYNFSKETFDFFFVGTAKGTVLVPYYLVKDFINDKKVSKELSQYKTETQNIIIRPKEKVTIAVLTKKYSVPELDINFSDTLTDKQYQIGK